MPSRFPRSLAPSTMPVSLPKIKRAALSRRPMHGPVARAVAGAATGRHCSLADGAFVAAALGVKRSGGEPASIECPLSLLSMLTLTSTLGCPTPLHLVHHPCFTCPLLGVARVCVDSPCPGTTGNRDCSSALFPCSSCFYFSCSFACRLKTALPHPQVPRVPARWWRSCRRRTRPDLSSSPALARCSASSPRLANRCHRSSPARRGPSSLLR